MITMMPRHAPGKGMMLAHTPRIIAGWISQCVKAMRLVFCGGDRTRDAKKDNSRGWLDMAVGVVKVQGVISVWHDSSTRWDTNSAAAGLGA